MSEEEQQPSDRCLIQRFRSHRDFTLREFGILTVNIHLYLEPPILRSPMCSFPSFSPFWLYAHMTIYQVTTTIPLVGVSGFTKIMCIRSLELRYADSRSPLYTLHLSSTDSWVAHSLYLLSGNRVSRFRDV
jgi:hypothetical protein